MTLNSKEQIGEQRIIAIPDRIVVKDLAERLKMPVSALVAELFKNGVMSSMNERIDFETAGIIAEDLGFTIEREQTKEEEQEEGTNLLEQILSEDTEHLVSRPPVVVVMGHVDHGKTTLLDAIRKTNVAQGETGGITQSIGAYQVEDKGKLITFLDTPGHEAFFAMRSRGARVADVAILVVAADDGVQPQTNEALQIIQKNNLPFVVALNKIDKPEANPDRVKKELADAGILPEEWGGKMVIVPVSALRNQGIAELLDMVLLVAEIEKEIMKANPKREGMGTIVESHIDKGAGPVATVLVQNGTLRVSDLVLIGDVVGKVKALKDAYGTLIPEALPSQPVQVLGLKGVPKIGNLLHVTRDRKEFRERERQARKQGVRIVPDASLLSQHHDESEESREQKKIKFPIALKTDTLGSQEAILASLEKFKDQEMEIVIVSKGLGNITEKNILDADSTSSLLLGFNVALTPQAETVQKDRRVKIQIFSVIYELLTFVRKNLEELLSPEIIREDIGKIQILATFRKEPSWQIIGGKVIEGKVENRASFRLLRGGVEIGVGRILELQSQKRVAEKVLQDSECGMKISANREIQAHDVLTVYRETERRRKLG